MKELDEKKSKKYSSDDDLNNKLNINQHDKSKTNSTLLQIYVTTSNLPNAGTNANVFLQLYKTKRINSKSKRNQLITESLKFPLEHMKSSVPKTKKKFQPGHIDLFEIEDETFDIENDELERIRVSTDARPLVNAGWHLKRIVIRIPTTNKEYTFECAQWLDALEAKDKKSQRDLFPSKVNVEEVKEKKSKDRKKLIDFDKSSGDDYENSFSSDDSSRVTRRHSSRSRSKK
jgi:hypothetical protein